MEAFSQGTIDTLNELFGRTKLITKLRKYAERQDNVNLIGSRRMGKTCILKTLQSTIKEDPNSNIYPFFIDISETDIKGNTGAVYRYIIAHIISDLNQDGYWCDEDITLNSVTFHSKDQLDELYEDAIITAQSPVKVQSMFYSLVKKINMELRKTVLLLFDEYEKLMKYAFDEPAGFYRMRNMATDRNLNFAFIVAGHEKWDRVISQLGSGELNVVNVEESVIPLSQIEFHEMWTHECNKIEDVELREKVSAHEGRAFDKSGGVPFFGKSIGAYLVVNNAAFPSYCNVSVNEIMGSLDRDERILLSRIDKGDDVQLTPPLESLRAKGLVIRDGITYKISMGFIKDVLRSNEYVSELRHSSETPSEGLARECIKLIQTINSTRKNNGFPYTFEPVNDSGSLEEDLRTQCFNKTDFEDFCSALYRNHFERSKDNIIKEKLPKNFKNTRFVKIVDVLRHSYGAHERDTFVVYPDKMSLPEALIIIHGSTNEPYLPEEFSNMQNKLLEMYKTELKGILTKAQNDTWTE